MRSKLRNLFITLAVVGILASILWGYRANQGKEKAEKESEAPITAPSRVSAEDGQTVLRLDQDELAKNGIRTTALPASWQRLQTQATGVVVQLQPLVDLEASYNTPRTDLIRTRANATASAQEYHRLLALNQDGKNASDKAVEAARAAAESDAALVANAERAITVLNASALLHWGPVLSEWMERSTPQFQALLKQKLFLLQVTSTTPGPFRSPRKVTVQLPDGRRTEANFISVLPQVDARLQTPSRLYVISSHPGLVPGENLSVFLPTGAPESGVVVPSAAVVWSQGSAWCYVETSPGKFVRTEVNTLSPVATGWFITQGLEAGTRVVTAGAQTLLSEEFRSQIQADTD